MHGICSRVPTYNNDGFLCLGVQVLSEMKKWWKHCWINKNGSWNPCLRITSVSSPQHHHPRLLVTEDQQTQVIATRFRVLLLYIYVFNIMFKIYFQRTDSYCWPIIWGGGMILPFAIVCSKGFRFFFVFRGPEAYKRCREKIPPNVYKTFNSRTHKTRATT